MSQAVQGRKEHRVYVIRIDWLIDHPVGMTVLVRVEVVDVGQAKIYMGVVMMPLGKVVVHHWAKGWRK